MCPATITASTALAISLAASVATAAATGIASYKSSSDAAKAQTAYQEAQGKAHNEAMVLNAKTAINEQVEQSAAERIAQMQDQASTAEQKQQLQIERLKAQGQAVASSQASGTAFDMLLADYERVEAQKKDIMTQQLEMKGVQHNAAVDSMQDKTNARIKSQQGFIASPVSQPSWGLTALGIAGSAASAATNYYGMTGKSTDPTDTKKISIGNPNGEAGYAW